MDQGNARSNAFRITQLFVPDRGRGERNGMYEAVLPDDALTDAWKQLWWNLTEADWDEAFNAHPRIGDVNALKQVRECVLCLVGFFP